MAQSDVSGSVLSIIAAFTSGLDIFKKLREKSPPKKSKRAHDSGRRKQESQLSKSLHKGRVEIHKEYERNLDRAGARFATGDGKSG